VLPIISQGLLLTVFLGLSFVVAAAQDTKQTKSSAAEDDVIKITSNLVSVDVMVKDKKGKALTNLKAEDFTVTENGVRQSIEFFDSPLTTANKAGQPAIGQPGTLTSTRLPKKRHFPGVGRPNNRRRQFETRARGCD